MLIVEYIDYGITDIDDVLRVIEDFIQYYIVLQIFPLIIYGLVRLIVKKNLHNIEPSIKEENTLDYFRDCFDLSIANLGVLYDYSVSDDHIAALLIDLEARGYIDCSGERVNIIQDWKSNTNTVEGIFLASFGRTKHYDVFRTMVKDKLLNETFRLGYLKKFKGVPKTFVISCLVFILTIIIAYYTDMERDYSLLYYFINRVSFLFSLVSLIIYIYRIMTPFIRSKYGIDIYNKLMALRNYINDFGNLDDLPPEAVNYRGKFYLYSVMFGYNEDVTKEYIEKLRGSFKTR